MAPRINRQEIPWNIDQLMVEADALIESTDFGHGAKGMGELAKYPT